MNTTKQLSENQQKAIAIVQKLVEDKKIEFSDAFQLIAAIYENEKEFVYVPYQPFTPQPWTIEPYTDPNSVPWWNRQILCGTQANTAQADPNKPGTPIYCYTIAGNPNSPRNIDCSSWRGQINLYYANT
jgi:hypothetical protein